MEKKTLVNSIVSGLLGAFFMAIVYFILNNWILNRQEKRSDYDKLQTQIIEVGKTKENKADAIVKYQELKSDLKEKADKKEVTEMKDGIEAKLNGLKESVEDVKDLSKKLLLMHMHATKIDTLKPLIPIPSIVVYECYHRNASILLCNALQ
jgi:hypothetical protein